MDTTKKVGLVVLVAVAALGVFTAAWLNGRNVETLSDTGCDAAPAVIRGSLATKTLPRNAEGKVRIGDAYTIKWTGGLRLFGRGAGGTVEAEIPWLAGPGGVHAALGPMLRKLNRKRASDFVTAFDVPMVLDGFKEASPSWEWSAGTTYEIRYLDDAAVSVLETCWEYTGGAHGNTALTGLTVVMGDDGVPRQLALAELFLAESDWQARLLRATFADLRRQGASDVVEKDPGPTGAGSLTVADLQAYTLSPAGLSFHFSPYHVGCYAEGCFEVTVPLEVFRDCLQEQEALRGWYAPGAEKP